MSSEAIKEAYQFRPAGHEAPAARREYPEPDKKLQKAFEGWEGGLSKDLDWHHEATLETCYTRALDLTKKLEFSLDEVHGLLLQNQDHQYIKYAGLFVSTLFNTTPEKFITYDLELEPIHFLGYRLAKDKVLINRSKVGRWMGERASGPVINYGEADRGMGWQASGPVINFGKTISWFGAGASGSVINYGEVKSMGASAIGYLIAARDPEKFVEERGRVKRTLMQKDCESIPALHAYLDELRQKFERGRCDDKALLAALDELGPEPGRKIEQDIADILKTKRKYRKVLKEAGKNV